MMRRAPAATAPSRAPARRRPGRPRRRVEPARPRGIHDGADARQHRAAKQRRLVERQVCVDLDQRAARYSRVLGKSRDAEWWCTALPSRARRRAARQQGAGAVGGGARLAQRRPTRRARQAVAAARHEYQHDVVALLEIVDARAGLDHDSRRPHGPMPSASAAGGCRRSPTGPNGTGRRRHAHEHLARTRRRELDLCHAERTRDGIGPGVAPSPPARQRASS